MSWPQLGWLAWKYVRERKRILGQRSSMYKIPESLLQDNCKICLGGKACYRGKQDIPSFYLSSLPPSFSCSFHPSFIPTIGLYYTPTLDLVLCLWLGMAFGTTTTKIVPFKELLFLGECGRQLQGGLHDPNLLVLAPLSNLFSLSKVGPTDFLLIVIIWQGDRMALL